MMKVHQHKIDLAVSKSFDCGLGIDDIEHFILQCTLYDELHQVLKPEVKKVWEACESRDSLNLSVQFLLFPFAIDQLTYMECHEILTATPVQTEFFPDRLCIDRVYLRPKSYAFIEYLGAIKHMPI